MKIICAGGYNQEIEAGDIRECRTCHTYAVVRVDEQEDSRVVLPGRVDVWRWEIGKRVVLQRPWREGGPRDIDTWKLFHEHVELRDGDSLRRTVNGEQVVYRGLVNVSYRREVVTLLPQDST